MQVNNTGYLANSYSQTAQSKAGGGFASLISGQGDPAEMLKEITKDGMKGLWSWQMKQLKEKIAAEVMGEMNVTAESIAKMPENQRVGLEKKIMDEVQKRLEIAMTEQANKEKSGRNELGTSFRMPPVAGSGSGGTLVDILA